MPTRSFDPCSIDQLLDWIREIEEVFGEVEIVTEEDVMGLNEFLGALKPELNDGFEVLEGVYRCVVKNEEKAETGFTSGFFKNGDPYERLQMTVDVTDVLSGNGNPGRRLWMRYNLDEKGLTKLVNDLFTANLLEGINRTSVEGLKETLPNVAGKTLYVRAWGWTPEKDRDGTLLPEEQRRTVQQYAVKSEKSLKKVLAQTSATPF